MIGSTFHPTMQFLWDGVPFDELGIADALQQASFTTTVGRGSPSRTYKIGKPKVGGANVDFVAFDRAIERRIMDLIRVRRFPVISVSAGYQDGSIYWLGAFRIHDVKTTYGKGVTISINGETNKAVQMKEDMRPKSYEGRTGRQILEEIAKEHKVVLKIDPTMKGLDVPLKSLTKTNRESMWQFTNRVASMAGGAGLFFVIRNPQSVRSNAGGNSRVAKLLGKSTEPNESVQYELHVTPSPGFINLSVEKPDATPRIGNCSRRDTEEVDQVDIQAKEISFSEEGKYASAKPAAAKVKADDTKIAMSLMGFATEQQTVNPLVAEDIFKLFGQKTGTGGRTTQRVQDHVPYRDGELPGTSIYRQVHDILPSEIDGTGLNSARMLAAAIEAHATITADVDLVPAQPWIQAPGYIYIVNTVAYNGLWGVETSKLTFTKGAGLVQTLTCKPAKLEGDKKPKQKGQVPPVRQSTFGIPERGVKPTVAEFTGDKITFHEVEAAPTTTELAEQRKAERTPEAPVPAEAGSADSGVLQPDPIHGYFQGGRN